MGKAGFYLPILLKSATVVESLRRLPKDGVDFMICFELGLERTATPRRDDRMNGMLRILLLCGILFQADTWGAIPREEGEFRKPELVELIRLDPTIRLDVRYATTNNFAHRAVYREARAFLQRPAAEALVRVHRALARQGLGLMVFDGYRPWSVVKLFWDITAEKDKKFVADPRRGSTHSRGCAVDLTLYDVKTGKPVEMPGGYDEWSERSAIDYSGGTPEARRHRELLCSAMEVEGFIHAPAEWWHYTYRDWELYRNMNLDFSEIKLPAPARPAD